MEEPGVRRPTGEGGHDAERGEAGALGDHEQDAAAPGLVAPGVQGEEGGGEGQQADGGQVQVFFTS